jgi:23S rRNA pseudouridine1911/1915/1917 synthase
MSDLRRIHLTDADRGLRLDQALCRYLNLSRSEARSLLQRGHVLLNGATVAAKGRILSPDDQLEIRPFDRTTDVRAIPNPDAPLHPLAQGPNWIIVNKPAGAAVHPLQPHEQHTVLNALIARYPHIQGVGEGGLRSGVVHRLDVTTSGTLLFALDQPTWHRLRTAFRTHRAEKIYHALVHGRLTGSAHQEMHLAITQHHPAKVRVVPPTDPSAQSRRCSLAWRAIQTFPDATLLEISLETGFLHQIRAMFAHLGHPLLGDPLYTCPSLPPATLPDPSHPALPAPARPMLHALSLRIDEITATCDPPDDFRALVTELQDMQ